MTIRAFASAFMLAASSLMPIAVWSSGYAERPITFIAPFAPGSTTDAAARVLVQHMARKLGQPGVIDNKVGAGGTIGLTAGARSKPDGHTLVFTGMSAHVLAPLTMEGLQWDPVKSFAPIGQVAVVPQVMAVPATLPVKTLAEFVAYAKARPGQLTHATLGPTTAPSLGMALFQQRTGISMREIPYKSAAQIYPDVASGRVDFVLDNLANALPLIQSGKLRPLAVTTGERMEVLADVPTISESVLPGFKLTSWVGLVAPAGTPPEVVAEISSALISALESPEYKQWLSKNGAQAPEAPGAKQFGALIESDLKMWRSAVELTGAKTPK